MDVLEAIAITAAGVGAGTINAVVGSGTLITFPVLLGLGYAPVTANVSNTLGLTAGNISGVVGYRRELRDQGARARRLGIASLLGGILGAVLLLVLPASAFKTIVPGFIALALVLVVFQPPISRRLAARRRRVEHGGLLAAAGLFGCGVYGGYFGAAQGIIALAVLGLSLDDDLQRLNGLKNVLIALTNGVAALVFVVAATNVAWTVAALIAVGSIAGGQLGARVGRRLPAAALRAVIVLVGIAAIVKIVV